MGEAEELAAKIAGKASDTVAHLQREMDIMKWPEEFQAIMWGAVRDEAAARALAAERMAALKARQAAGA